MPLNCETLTAIVGVLGGVWPGAYSVTVTPLVAGETYFGWRVCDFASLWDFFSPWLGLDVWLILIFIEIAILWCDCVPPPVGVTGVVCPPPLHEVNVVAANATSARIEDRAVRDLL